MEEIVESVELFVPAIAVQHPDNPEDANISDRIRYAVMRWHEHQTFDGPLPKDIGKYFFLEKRQMLKEPLGYKVYGYIKSV